jgi:hydrogenase 3 maturation protease
MADLALYLAQRLLGANKLFILGAGSRLKADDAAGVMVSDRLMERFGAELPGLRIASGETAPENFTGDIKRFAPDHLIIVDAADFGAAPGSVSTIEPCVVSGVSFSTHMLPMKVMLQYLGQELACQVTILGIQPVLTDFGADMSAPVTDAVEEVTKSLSAAVVSLGLAG